MRSAIIMLVAIWVTVTFPSCENQQELCFDHGNARIPVKVVFDWTDCPDANPATMSLYLFSKDGYRRYEFNGHRGGSIMIAPGRYSALAVNSDSERTAVRNTSSLESFEIWLRGDFAVSQQRADDPLCNESDMMWIGLIEDLKCEGCDSVVVKMYEAICRFSVDILKVGNPQRLSSVSATISGMNESVSALDRHTATAKSVRIGFALERKEINSLHGSLLTLGHCGRQRSRGDPTCELPHVLSLYFNFEDGTRRIQTVDVADQIHNQNVDDCHIVIDSVAVPIESPPYGGGFKGTVSDWGEEVDIIIKP